MPVAPTYPGVYIEEIPSGVRTIVGVATAITAFVGRAARGPTDEPVTINGFGDFTRIFGGLWAESTLGYAVRDFFANGGGQAIIVRAYKKAAAGGPSATLNVNDLHLIAKSPGAWGNNLRVRIDHNTRDLLPGEAANSLFNLSVKDTQSGQIELLRNVSVTVGHARRIDRVLAEESSLVLVDKSPPTPIPGTRPAAHDVVPAGQDPFSDAVSARYTSVVNANKGSDGVALTAAEISAAGLESSKSGMFALLKADLFNILCIPPHKPSAAADTTGRDLDASVIDAAASFCRDRRAFLIVDPPYGSTKTGVQTFANTLTKTSYAALYFPALMQPNPLHDNQLEEFAPCGAVAGNFARTDATRGVWKAPAGLEATLNGVPQLSVPLTDAENGELNPLGINCLRALPAAGRVIWGARTMRGADRLTDEYKYIPVRRLVLYLEETLFRSTQWVVFEPNDEPLWSQIRLNIGAFMQSLFRQGAFQGKTPREAYFVKCDRETTTQTDINLGIVNIVVGFAPLKPAEFVIIKIQQMAGDIPT